MASKVAAVIGYGPGIGHSCAALWAANGYTVALVSRTASKLEAAAKIIPNAKPYPCDITDDHALRACLVAIARALGPIDDVIYNAGNGVWKKFDEISVDQLDAAMKTNVYGLLSTCQVATPAMIKRGSTSSPRATASLRGMPFTSAFASAKAAQKSLAQSVARQLWAENVHVYAIDASPDCWTFMHHIQTSVSDMALL
ncbi:3-oxo-behenoyl-CoA reductase [Aureococcus anophagefferens]|nr:3-oxo-behenoyl-CoA reductase [Aureococcus anophagefferens]